MAPIDLTKSDLAFIQSRARAMRAGLVHAAVALGLAYGNPRYVKFEIEHAVFLLKRHKDNPDVGGVVDRYLCGMWSAPSATFIKTAKYPHRNSACSSEYDAVASNLTAVALSASSSEHSGRRNWWRAPKHHQTFVHVAIALLICIPETGQPDERCRAMIHGICDHYSDASHGAAYRGCIPTAPLRFVLDLAHHIGWCQRHVCVSSGLHEAGDGLPTE